VDESARKSTHSASHQHFGEIEEKEKQQTPRVRIRRNFDEDRSTARGLSSLFTLLPSITERHPIPISWLGSCERREHICLTLARESDNRVNKVRRVIYFVHVSVRCVCMCACAGDILCGAVLYNRVFRSRQWDIPLIVHSILFILFKPPPPQQKIVFKYP